MENYTEVEKRTIENTDNSSLEQIISISKWSRFVGLIFIIFSLTIALTCIFLFLNYEKILSLISQVNGMNDEMLEILRNGGKPSLLFFCFVSFSILFFNGYLLLNFGTKIKLNIIESFRYLNKYFNLSIAMGIISLIFTVLFMLTQIFSGF